MVENPPIVTILLQWSGADGIDVVAIGYTVSVPVGPILLYTTLLTQSIALLSRMDVRSKRVCVCVCVCVCVSCALKQS